MSKKNTNKFIDWSKTPLGKQITTEEEKNLVQVLEKSFGYFFLQLGANPYNSLDKHIQLSHKIYLDNDDLQNDKNSMIASPIHMPIQSDSIDTILLGHTIDTIKEKHELLRECSRVLITGGQLIIVSFNPYSYIALKRFLNCRSMHGPWLKGMLTRSRVLDWLELLEFDVVSSLTVFPSLPLGNYLNNKWMQFLSRGGNKNIFPFGSSYIIVAKKKEGQLITIKTKWSNGQEKAKSDNILET